MVDIVDLAAIDRSADIDGLWVVTLKQVTDDRGTVREFYRGSALADAGIPPLGPWAQVNLTETKAGAVRGMHAEAMTKLIGIAAGEAFGAWVDLRADSPTAGNVVTLELRPGVQVLVPAGVGNGFQAVTDCQYLYCFDAEWQPGMAGSAVTPLDPTLGIEWPVPIADDDTAQVSAKDRAAPLLADVLTLASRSEASQSEGPS